MFQNAGLLIWLVLSMPEYDGVRKNGGSYIFPRLTNITPSRCHQAETPSKPITIPPTGIFKICKDESSSASGRQVDQWHKKDEEETDMKDKGRSLNVRKYSDAEYVHQNGNKEYHPVKHRSMPSEWLVAFEV